MNSYSNQVSSHQMRRSSKNTSKLNREKGKRDTPTRSTKRRKREERSLSSMRTILSLYKMH